MFASESFPSTFGAAAAVTASPAPVGAPPSTGVTIWMMALCTFLRTRRRIFSSSGENGCSTKSAMWAPRCGPLGAVACVRAGPFCFFSLPPPPPLMAAPADPEPAAAEAADCLATATGGAIPILMRTIPAHPLSPPMWSMTERTPFWPAGPPRVRMRSAPSGSAPSSCTRIVRKAGTRKRCDSNHDGHRWR